MKFVNTENAAPLMMVSVYSALHAIKMERL